MSHVNYTIMFTTTHNLVCAK